MSFRKDLQEKLRQIEIILDVHINRGANTKTLIAEYQELVPSLTPEQIAQLDFDPFEELEIPESLQPDSEPEPKSSKKNKPKSDLPKFVDCDFCRHPAELNEDQGLYVCTNCPRKMPIEKALKR
jgi:hypothetical protein